MPSPTRDQRGPAPTTSPAATDPDDITTAERGILRVHSALQPGFGTEAAVYGTILVSGLVAVSSAHGETSFVVLLTVAVTVLVFWGAHV